MPVRALREALAACRGGDTLVVTKRDRLARSPRTLLSVEWAGAARRLGQVLTFHLRVRLRPLVRFAGWSIEFCLEG